MSLDLVSFEGDMPMLAGRSLRGCWAEDILMLDREVFEVDVAEVSGDLKCLLGYCRRFVIASSGKSMLLKRRGIFVSWEYRVRSHYWMP